jgi:hypothetical protein
MTCNDAAGLYANEAHLLAASKSTSFSSCARAHALLALLRVRTRLGLTVSVGMMVSVSVGRLVMWMMAC